MDSNQKTKKKRKSEGVNVEPESESNLKRVKVDPIEFNLLDRLHGNDPLSVFRDLDRILQDNSLDDNVDTIGKFLEQGGSARDFVDILNSETKVKTADVVVVFAAFELLLHHLAKRNVEIEDTSVAKKFATLALDLTRTILEDHIRYIVLVLSPSNTAHQVRTGLGLLTAMVACGPLIAKEVLLKLDFSHPSFESLAGRQNSQEIREVYIRFFLSFLLHSETGSLMRIYVDKCKNKLAEIFARIGSDSAQMIQSFGNLDFRDFLKKRIIKLTGKFILITLREKFVRNLSISKTDKMKVFSVTNLKPILYLCYKWKPTNLKPEELEEEETVELIKQVGEASREFFVALFTSHKLGIVFHDPTVGTSGSNQNHLLLNLLRCAENCWENENLSEIVVRSLEYNPDQLKPFCQKVLQPLWTPKPTQTWQQLSQLLFNILAAIDLKQLLADASKKPNFPKLSAGVVKNIYCNDGIFRDVIATAIDEPNDAKIRRQGIKIFGLIVEKLGEIFSLKVFKSSKPVLSAMTGKLPDLKAISEFWKSEVEALSKLEEFAKDSFSSLLNCAKILRFYKMNFSTLCTDFNVQDFMKASQTLFAKMNSSGFREESDTIQVILLEVLSTGTSSGKDLSTDSDIINLLVSIAVESPNVKNRDTALTTLAVLLNLDAILSDLLRIWLYLANAICDDPSKISVAFSTALMQRSDFKTELDKILGKYPKLLLNESLLAFIRSKVLKKKFKKFFMEALTQMALLQEDPVLFCDYLSSEEGLTEYLTKDKILEASIPGLQTEFTDLISAMKMLTAIKIKKDGTENFGRFLSESQHRELISAKILSQHWMKNNFDPSADNTDVQNLALDLLEFNKDVLVAGEYSRLFEAKLAHLLISRNSTQTPKSSILSCIDRAFKTINLSIGNVEVLLKTFVQSIEPKTFCERKGFFLCSIFTNLSKFHGLKFMDTLFEDSSRSFARRVIEMILQLDTLEDCHNKVLGSISDNFESDTDFWMSFPESAIDYGCKSKLRNSGKYLELLIRNSDHSRAAQFRQFAKDELEVVKGDLAKYLPPLTESLSRRFLSTMKPKAVKGFLQKFVGDILSEKASEVDEKFSDFVRKVSSDFNMTFELENFAPIEGTNYFCFRSFFDLFKNSSDQDENFLMKHILIRCVEIIPALLKDFSKNCDDDNLKIGISNYCKLVVDIVGSGDIIKLRKKFKGESDLWQNLVRGCLKHGLKLKLPFAVDVLSALCRAIYGKDDFVELSQIYDMVCGHSNFVDIALSTINKDVDLKSSVFSLILTLIQCKGGLFSSAQLPLFLGAYRATLYKSDRVLLRIIYHHDFKFENGVPLQAFKPLLWGDAAIAKYSHRPTNTKSRMPQLSKIPKISEVLGLVDVTKMVETSIYFPLDLTLDIENVTADDEEGSIDNPKLYDPRFFLHLFIQICSSDSYVDRHLKLVEAGVLCLALASLSSKDEFVRGAGATLLSRVFLQLESARKSLSAEKQVWLHLISVVRNGVADAAKSQGDRKNDVNGSKDNNDEDDFTMDETQSQETILRIPSVLSAFLVRTCMILNNPLDPLYKAVSNFLLAKPLLSVYSVPEFLRLFHSKDPLQHDVEREWILAVLRDGLRDDLSYSLMQQNFVFKMVQSFHDSSLAQVIGLDRTEEGFVPEGISKTQALILDFVANAAKLPKAAFDLVRNRGLLVWILSCVSSTDKPNAAYVEVLVQAWKSVSANVNPEKGLPTTTLNQFFVTSFRLLHVLSIAEFPPKFDTSKVLLEVLSEVSLMLKRNDETSGLISTEFSTQVQTLMKSLMMKNSVSLSDETAVNWKPLFVDFRKLVSKSLSS